MPQTLSEKSLTSTVWSLLDSFGSSGVSFIVGIILARILDPADFGIIGMLAIFIAVSNSIVDSGFSSALIRKLDAKNIDYNTVFIFNQLLSLILYFVLFFTAPSISSFYNIPILTSITRVISLVIIINSLAIIHRTILIKKIDFKTQSKISLFSSIVSGIIGILLALNGFGVWSLVWQQVSKQFFNTVLLWIFNKWYPLIEFSIDSFKELFGFGSKLLLSGLIDTIYNNIYYLVIGKFYTPAQLGQYTRAEQFSSIFSTNLTMAIQRVSYPILSTIQNDDEQLRNAFRKIIKTTMLVTFTFMFFLAAISKPLIVTLIGEKWLTASFYLQIICFAGALYPLHAINLNILQVKGKSNLFLKLELIKKLIAIIPIILGIKFGIVNMLVGAVVVSFISYFINSYYTGKILSYNTIKQIKDIFPVFTISFGISLLIWAISFLNFSNFSILIMQIFTWMILTFLVYKLIKLPEYYILKDFVFKFIKKKNE